MKWYKIYLNGENRIWKKCITYSWEFIYEDKEINFQRIIDSSSSERYQIKALIKGKGLIAKSISEFGQIRMPEFAEVSHLFLVREDILNINELSSIKGISLKRVSVHGDFPLDYMAIIFNEVISTKGIIGASLVICGIIVMNIKVKKENDKIQSDAVKQN